MNAKGLKNGGCAENEIPWNDIYSELVCYVKNNIVRGMVLGIVSL